MIESVAITPAELQKIPLFASLHEEALNVLISLMRPVNFSPSQTILREGESGDSFYIIVKGTVKFVTYNHKGSEVIFGEASEGEYFGELSMLTNQPRAARVVAVTETQTLALDFSAFEQFLLSTPHAAIEVMRTLALRIHKSDELLRETGLRNINEIDDDRRTLGDKISDGFAAIMGSWNFIIIQSILLLVWVGWNSIAHFHNQTHPDDVWFLWDPYPFVFLNLALSFQAAYAAPIIMMSQNRSARKDRLANEIDHQVNVKAELQIGRVIKRLDDLEQSLHHRFSRE